MADGEECQKLLKVSSCIRKCKLKYNSKHKRNRNRNLRRKRSKLKYIQRIRNLRSEKDTRSVYGALSVFNITDMDYVQDQSLQLPREVNDWQYRHQLAFWKSRAISLEYENRMLQGHIKRMCRQDVQDYVDYVKKDENQESIADNEPNSSSELETTENSDQLPEDGEDPQIEKKILYGDKEAKISAMETAMKVNYNMQLDRHKPQLWPNIPLNL